ncbi:MAG: hypothetical protein A4E49_01193 [Methanosaeta sp. PtaU1.Bin112]|nr:MAG: hypothetical protein A4E49_01193 [Methanosaeta sp. PtaU1.Bin112]
MHKDLRSHPYVPGPDGIIMESSVISGQTGLLNQGFYGFRLRDLPEGFEISYGKSQGFSHMQPKLS